MSKLTDINTKHGKIKLPAFMPDATYGSIRSISFEDARKAGVEEIVTTTLHIENKIGSQNIKKLGGVHKFFGWDRPILSDSGGWQVFSLINKDKKNTKNFITEAGCSFIDPETGEHSLLTPEGSQVIQYNMGADIVTVLDDPILGNASLQDRKECVRLNTLWARRAKAKFLELHGLSEREFEQSTPPNPLPSCLPAGTATSSGQALKEGEINLLSSCKEGEGKHHSISSRKELRQYTSSPLRAVSVDRQGNEKGVNGSNITSAYRQGRHPNPPSREVINSSRKELEQSVTSFLGESGDEITPSSSPLSGGEYGGRPLLGCVIQGGDDFELRKQSAEELIEIGFDIYNFGGVPMHSDISWKYDNPKGFYHEMLMYVENLIPDDKLKYAMGVGQPDDIAFCVDIGWELFDTVLPTRNARHGYLYVSEGEGDMHKGQGEYGYDVQHITSKRYEFDQRPVDNNCTCECCQTVSRAYLRHLLRIQEPAGFRLATIHNLRFYSEWMERLRRRRS